MTARCNTELITHRRTCKAAPARRFTAVCACLHEIAGYLCESCGLSRLPGCLTCWQDGAGHQCQVEFTSAECLCGCGELVGIATRNQTRDHIVKGRPMRYVTGHSARYRESRQQQEKALAAARRTAATVLALAAIVVLTAAKCHYRPQHGPGGSQVEQVQQPAKPAKSPPGLSPGQEKGYWSPH